MFKLLVILTVFTVNIFSTSDPYQDQRIVLMPFTKISVETLHGKTTDDFLNPSFAEETPLKYVFKNFSNVIQGVDYTNTFNGEAKTEKKDYILPIGQTTKGILLRKIKEITNNDYTIFKDVVHSLRKNNLYDESFLRSVDDFIVYNQALFSTQDIVSVFFDMSYLGYNPSRYLTTILISTVNQLYNKVIELVERDCDEQLLYKKSKDESSITSSVRRKKNLTIQQTPFELLSMMCIASSSISSLIGSTLYEKSFYHTIECLIYFQYYYTKYNGHNVTQENYFLFSNPFLKQQLYWALLVNASSYAKDDLAFRSINFLNSFFSKKRKMKEIGYLSSGTEVRMRDSLINMKRSNKINIFAAGLNSSALRTEIDFTCIDGNGKLTFFECDGPVHFIYPLSFGLSKSEQTPPHLNGQTFLKTAVLSLFGSVVRVSSICAEQTYYNRINELSYIFSSSDGTFSLVDPQNYHGFPTEFFKNLRKRKARFKDQKDAFSDILYGETGLLSAKQIKASEDHNMRSMKSR